MKLDLQRFNSFNVLFVLLFWHFVFLLVCFPCFYFLVRFPCTFPSFFKSRYQKQIPPDKTKSIIIYIFCNNRKPPPILRVHRSPQIRANVLRDQSGNCLSQRKNHTPNNLRINFIAETCSATGLDRHQQLEKVPSFFLLLEIPQTNLSSINRKQGDR